MTYTFTHKQANTLLECLDITIKQLGLKGVYRITELAHLLQNPVNETEEHFNYEIQEDQANGLREAMDTTVKVIGLQGAAPVLEILQILNTPPAPTDALEQAE